MVFQIGIDSFSAITRGWLLLADSCSAFVTMATVIVVIIILMIIFTLTGNSTICYIIYRVRRLHCPSCLFLVNLAINDILVGVVLLPFGVAATIQEANSVESRECDVIGYLQHVSSSVSVLTLLSVSIDRYLAIIVPLKYKGWVTKNKTILCIVAIWVYSLLTACFPLVGWSNFHFVPGVWLCESNYHQSVSFTYFKLATMYFLPLIAIVFIYISILRVALRHSRQIAREVAALRQRELPPVLDPEPDRQQSATVISGQYCVRKPHSALRADIKTALSLACIVGVLFISWTPYMVVNIWSFHSGKNAPTLLQHVVSGLYYVNLVINPYLYGYMNRLIKREFKTLWTSARSALMRIRLKQVHPSEISETISK
ncbi:G-protein coupled receptor 161-like isoform X2 [Acropora muricata]|uniref:G-protein coupled receptor 161-like isoform X2 n=1 Tax=Acropora millepora TaxID=45264 RepID=UPI0010FCA6DA|nr:G-protein coupled receptor 161-like isoform X2 [Acropora millepora]